MGFLVVLIGMRSFSNKRITLHVDGPKCGPPILYAVHYVCINAYYTLIILQLR